jgi:hypothetical protein
VRALATVLTAAGLAVLFTGTERAAPLVFFGTAEERAGLADGRRLMLVGAVILALAAALLALRGRAGRAALVLAPGTATTLVYAFPEASYAWLAFLVLAPAALVAAVSTLAGRAG